MIGKVFVQIFDKEIDNKFTDEKIIPSSDAFKKFGLKPAVPEAKEGLALINGTQMMTAFAVLISIRARTSSFPGTNSNSSKCAGNDF